MRPIIFLDGVGTIWTQRGAGVARTAVSVTAQGYSTGGPSVRNLESHSADPDGILALNVACRRTGAKVVILGPWRVCESGANLEAALAHHGVTAELHSDWRTDGDGPDFEKEVERWLKAHPDVPGHAIVAADAKSGPRRVRPAHHTGIGGQAPEIAAAVDGVTRAEIVERWSAESAQELRRAVGR